VLLGKVACLVSSACADDGEDDIASVPGMPLRAGHQRHAARTAMRRHEHEQQRPAPSEQLCERQRAPVRSGEGKLPGLAAYGQPELGRLRWQLDRDGLLTQPLLERDHSQQDTPVGAQQRQQHVAHHTRRRQNDQGGGERQLLCPPSAPILSTAPRAQPSQASTATVAASASSAALRTSVAAATGRAESWPKQWQSGAAPRARLSAIAALNTRSKQPAPMPPPCGLREKHRYRDRQLREGHPERQSRRGGGRHAEGSHALTCADQIYKLRKRSDPKTTANAISAANGSIPVSVPSWCSGTHRAKDLAVAVLTNGRIVEGSERGSPGPKPPACHLTAASTQSYARTLVRWALGKDRFRPGAQERQAAPARTEYRVDEIARWVASPVSRRRALKLSAGAFAGSTIIPLLPRSASAQSGYITCSPETKDCFAYTCPTGTTCCPIPDNHLHKVYCPTGGCCDPCSPNSSQCDGNGRCVAGPVAKNCPCTPASGGVVCGNDCCRDGQVCCHRFFSRTRTRCCTRDDQLKGNCSDVKWEATIAGAALGVAAIAAGVLLPPVGVALGYAAAASGAAAIAADICASDPPDPDFKAIFVPTVPRLPRLRPGKQLTPKAVGALRQMSANNVRYGAYKIAWIRSMEKALGAAQANDTQWARRHRTAAAKYARTAATALERDHRLRSNARHQLHRAGFRDFKITSAQARSWQRQINTHGLPSQMEAILREARLDVKRRQALRHDLVQVDPKAIAHLGLFGELDDNRYQKANTAMVRSMRQSADSLSAGA
jgi:hypothetical protein